MNIIERDLEAENAKLRDDVERMFKANVEKNGEIARLLDENAKLRDFVYDMWNDMNVYYMQNESPDSSDMEFYLDRMRKLGIEVGV